MKQFIVDAFTDTVFKGNQAAVCVTDRWLSEELMMNIARENMFSETAFTVKEDDTYRLRWFTPGGEIDFCGHATLGTAFVLFSFFERKAEILSFTTAAGIITVRKEEDTFVMNFPAYRCIETEVTDRMEEALGIRPLAAYIDRDLLLVLPDESSVRTLNPKENILKELDGLLTAVTAPSDSREYDCVSRVFGPKIGIKEDPVTGSSHCMIVPYWNDRLHKDSLVCFQASERTGILYCSRNGDRISIAGKAVLYSEGEILKNHQF